MAASGVCTRGHRPLTVLFVDDDADCRFSYQLIATGEGMSAELARDGHEAIALAESVLPDVVVLDIGLTSHDGLDGFEVARRLRANVRTSTIPILFLSGHDSARHLVKMAASGCEGYLVKPCSADALLGLVTELAKRRRDHADGDARVSGA